MNKENSINKFFKKNNLPHLPAAGLATVCGVIVEADYESGLAKNVSSFIYGEKVK